MIGKLKNMEFIPDNIKNIVSKIEEFEAFRKNSNDDLLSYCTDKSYPLKDRWEIWEKLVIKENYNYARINFKSPILKFLNDKYIKYRDTHRYEMVYWWTLLNEIDMISERDHVNMKHLIRKVTIESILEDKEVDFYSYTQEELMKENFNSYRYDW